MKTIHDLMLDQELQSFREEIEWRCRNSVTNSSYKYPYMCQGDGSDPDNDINMDVHEDCIFILVHSIQ